MIRPAIKQDEEALWQILEPIIRAGETYTIDRDISRADALAYWMGSPDHCFVMEEAGEVLGTYYLRKNQNGGGSHVCNCGYMVDAKARGRGIARAMCEDSMARARAIGFSAMQFNFVVSTNIGAVHLWESLGFAIAGRLPEAFISPQHGLVDAYVMYKKL